MVVRQIFYEDFGDLGSLPTPQTSTSKPVRPHRDAPIIHQLCDKEATASEPLTVDAPSAPARGQWAVQPPSTARTVPVT